MNEGERKTQEGNKKEMRKEVKKAAAIEGTKTKGKLFVREVWKKRRMKINKCKVLEKK